VIENLAHERIHDMRPHAIFFLFFLLVAACFTSDAQGNYEIQVYAADTVAPGNTMIELHSNFTAQGSKTTTDGTFPTDRQEHETVEITQGWTNWFETGLYIFTSAGPNGQNYRWVGDHIRPRVRVPEKWKWPVGVSLSMEIGYQRPIFSRDTWTWEIRPIVDKQLGPWYLAFNPAFERSWHGPSVTKGLEFSPAVKASYQFNKKIAGGFEYYGTTGPVTGFDPLTEQQQQFFPTVDLDFGPAWEFNFGVGVGVTHGTDHLIVKWILGRRFNFFPNRGRHASARYNVCSWHSC
jgi:hypothetical protein